MGNLDPLFQSEARSSLRSFGNLFRKALVQRLILALFFIRTPMILIDPIFYESGNVIFIFKVAMFGLVSDYDVLALDFVSGLTLLQCSFGISIVKVPSNIFGLIDLTYIEGKYSSFSTEDLLNLLSYLRSHKGRSHRHSDTKIWDPSNSEGAERIPTHIVASESNIYSRRLWGLPREVIPNAHFHNDLGLDSFRHH
ncbi:hypothetical protein T459_23178 [Capsicum annuum]|uniref:Uncharacterized protein n=1 Tax=Capsicum annuum TaxID=4072 RepID=A0A2G2YRM3_CAPAN|nr:hypothetical protein T459_23178 [Capsicum annuum]